MTYERHPLSAVWPDLEPTALEALRDSMLRRGYDDHEPVVLYKDLILDGWHRLLVARELGIEVPTIDYQGDDPAGFVIGRHAGRRHLPAGQRAHCVVSCRDWASAGRPASRKPSADRGEGAPETRSVDRVSARRPSTNQELAAEADVSESTIRRAKAAIRKQKEEHNEASTAVQPAAAPPGAETQAPAVDAGPVAVDDARRVAPPLRAGVEQQAPVRHNESSAGLEGVLSQGRVARHVGCTQQYVSRIREQVTTGCDLPDRVVDRDGKLYSARRPASARPVSDDFGSDDASKDSVSETVVAPASDPSVREAAAARARRRGRYARRVLSGFQTRGAFGAGLVRNVSVRTGLSGSDVPSSNRGTLGVSGQDVVLGAGLCSGSASCSRRWPAGAGFAADPDGKCPAAGCARRVRASSASLCAGFG